MGVVTSWATKSLRPKKLTEKLVNWMVILILKIKSLKF